MSNRRNFLQWAGAGAAASWVAGKAFAQTASSPQQADDSTRAKHPLNLGLTSYTFREFSRDQTFAMTSRVGLKHICLKDCHLPYNDTPEQLADAAKKAKAAGLDLYGAGVVYMENVAEVNRAFDYAKAAGLRIIVGVPRPEFLALVDEKVKQYDIPVAIHNHGPGDEIYPTPDIIYSKIKSLDKRIGLCIDVGHTALAGVDPSQAIEQFADRLYDVHIKDVSEASEHGETVPIGRGVIDIPRVLRTLQKVRFAGVVSFEYEKEGKDPLPGVAESVGYVNGVLAVI